MLKNVTGQKNERMPYEAKTKRIHFRNCSCREYRTQVKGVLKA